MRNSSFPPPPSSACTKQLLLQSQSFLKCIPAVVPEPQHLKLHVVDAQGESHFDAHRSVRTRLGPTRLAESSLKLSKVGPFSPCADRSKEATWVRVQEVQGFLNWTWYFYCITNWAYTVSHCLRLLGTSSHQSLPPGLQVYK